MLLGQKLAMTASQNGGKTAFRYLAKGQSFKDAYTYINRYSYFLQNEIGHGKKILVYMSNCPHMAYTFFALANTKNVAVFVDPNSSEPRIVDKIKELDINAIIVSDDYVTRVKEFCRNNNFTLPIIQCESRRWGEYDTTYRLPVSVATSDNDVVALFETAGTSGKPKLVPYTHTMLQQVALVLRSTYRTSAVDNFFTYGASLAQSFYFIHGLFFPFFSGLGTVITDIVAPDELAKELTEGKVSRVVMKGWQVEEWLTSFKNINVKLPYLKSITVEYGRTEARVEQMALNDFNVKILNTYGSVETCWAASARHFEDPEPSETVGQFLPGLKTRIVDENGDDLPANKPQRGQLLVSGAIVATTYHDNKEAAKMHMRGAWFFTGDYVDVDKKGIVTFLDRKDNICRVAGQIVAPKEVEAVLSRCPGIDQVAILGLKDGLGKFVLTAVVSRKVGVDLSTQDLNEFSKAHLPEIQRPKAVAFIQEMPLDSHGLINKYKLRFELGAT